MIDWLVGYVDKFKEDKISEHLNSAIIKSIETLKSDYFNPDVRSFFDSYQKNTVPFSNFELEPDNVSQIKKLINALYYAKLSFQDLEKINTDSLKTISTHVVPLYTKTIHNGYIACQLFTHLDVDLRGIFAEELNVLLPILKKVQDTTGNYSEEQKQLAQAIKTYPLSYNVGLVTGITVNQLQPSGGDLDYTFLTQFSGILPAYIQHATQLIQKYSSQLITDQPSLNREKIEEYRNLAMSLLNNLEDLKGNDFFVSLKLLNYIKIINQVITLSMSILDQIGKLNNTSQDWIRDQLAKLKYEVLPTLFGLIDKIEDNTMLKPGTLSIPLMKQIEPLYQFLIHYSRKVVNFDAKGAELLTIVDAKFLALRLEWTHKRIDEADKALFKINQAQLASTKFYKIINSLKNQNQCVHELTIEQKNELVEYYKIIKPFLDQADIDLSTELSHSLQGSETWESWLKTPLRMFRGEKAIDHLSQVLASKKQIEHIFKKAKVSKEFHTKLNQKLIGFVNNQSDVAIFPHNNTNNILVVDESAILAVNSDSKLKYKNNTLQNPEILSSEQALDFHQWYKNKQNKLKIAKDAYLKFMDLIKGNHLQLTYAQRCQARILYPIFQAYFVCGAPEQRRKEIIDCDTYLSQMFAIKKITAPIPARGLFDNLHQHYQKLFTDTEDRWQQQSKKYWLLAQEKFQAEHYAQKLEVNDINKTRAHYLIKHQEYSQAVKEFRTSLHNVIKQFNTAMQTELTIKALDTLPYPEVEDANTVLAQPKQVLAVKQIINSLYHVEQIIYQLEQVKEVPATESKLTRPFNEFRNSVYYLIMAYSHLNQIIKASRSLIKDPHLKLMGQDLLEKAQTTLATLQEHTYAYGVAPPTTAPKNDTVRYNALWYVINSVFVIPIHIRSLRNNNYISAEELNELNLQAKNATVTIETIIKDSGSYLKLFLLAPNMHKLYQRLKKKLNEFTSTTHDAVMHNLAEIQTSIFAPMLLEADLWEDRMGLNPGIISGPMKRIVEEYYKGLLYPLGLYSKKHLNLICDKSIFSKRQEVAHTTIVEAKNKISRIKEKKQHIEELYELLKLNEPYFKPDDHQLWSEEFKQKAITQYRLCIPRLAKIQQKLNIQIKANATERQFDNLLQATNQFNDPKISNIRAVVHAAFHYYKGREKTAAMNRSIAEEKIVYIKDLQQKQVQEDLKFIEEYTTKAYHRELNAICNRHVGLQYMDKEYSKELRIHLLKFEKSIIMTSKMAEDINLSVQTMLRKRASQFEKKQFAEYYHLDSVRAALAGFKIYLSNETADTHSLFEDDKTLNAKSERIKIVDDIASNADLSIAERFKQIKQQVVIDGSFKKVLCARKDTDFLSWTYLKQCFINLLEAIYLYSSPRKKLSADIVSAVNNKPEIKVLINRFGLFSANQQKPKANTSPTIVLPEPKLLT